MFTQFQYHSRITLCAQSGFEDRNHLMRLSKHRVKQRNEAITKLKQVQNGNEGHRCFSRAGCCSTSESFPSHAVQHRQQPASSLMMMRILHDSRRWQLRSQKREYWWNDSSSLSSSTCLLTLSTPKLAQCYLRDQSRDGLRHKGCPFRRRRAGRCPSLFRGGLG